MYALIVYLILKALAPDFIGARVPEPVVMCGQAAPGQDARRVACPDRPGLPSPVYGY